MKQILKRIFHHEELTREEACKLTREEACTLMQRMTGGEMNEAQTAALLAAFQMRGVKVDELVGFRDALLQACVPVDFHEFHPIDIVGTGGDGKNTFNISTCACFVVALCRGRSRLPGSQARKLRSHFSKRGQQRDGTLRRKIHKRREQTETLHRTMRHGLSARSPLPSRPENRGSRAEGIRRTYLI